MSNSPEPSSTTPSSTEANPPAPATSSTPPIEPATTTPTTEPTPEPANTTEPANPHTTRKPTPQSRRAQPTRHPKHINHDAALFTLISIVTLATATTGLTALWPTALAAARSQSANLTQAGNQTSGGEALTDFQLATWLDPHNQAAYAGLAREQILAGRADDALMSLAQAGQGSEVLQLKIRTLIELGHYNEAANQATQLTAPGRSSADITLAGLSFALAGRPTSDIDNLMGLVAAPEALQTLRRAQAGNLPLAAELYATGLLRSSSAILTKLPGSYERDLLLARINLARHTPESLNAAIGYLQSAISVNPADTTTRTLLAQTYHELDQADAAAAQETAISKLQAGRP